MAENDIKIEDLSEEQIKLLQLDPIQAFDFSQKATFQADQALGITAGAITAKTVDNKVINDYISKIETPTGKDVYSKQAAMYRAQGEGALLRTQRDLRNLFLPTIDLIQKREAAAMARFTLLKNRMPEFDDTTIFGDQSDNPMPVADEIKNISAQTKEDLRMLSRLSPNDERYEEIKNRVETNQKSIVEFDAVNKKLLEIRNAGTDESQWSKGMDPTTINMWKDIYTSNGKNIKIQDGKLVWTDEKGTNIYDIPDDNTGGNRAVYDDKTFEILRNSKGDDPNSEQYKRAVALEDLHWYSDQAEYSGNLTNNKAERYGESITKQIQNALNTLGITDNEGKALEVDGKFGPKTREAYDKYLAQKGKLNKQHLDKYMTEEDAAKYRTKSGVGETKIIDLSQIGDGPTTIHNGAVNQDIIIRGNAQKLINQGIGIDEPMYNTLIKKEIASLNDVGPDGIKSLIFDGLRNDEDSIYAGMNTDTFLEQVISQHYGDDLSAAEIEEKIQLMRSQDVTQMYNNGKGGQDTLQTQFLEWYKKQIDQKIIEGKKSTITTDLNQTDPNQTDPNQRSGGDPDDDNDIRTNWSAVSSDDNSIVDGNLVRVKVGTRTMSVGDGPRTDYPNAQMVFRNGQAYFVTDNNVPITNNVSYSRNDAIAFFRNAYGISYTQAEEFVDAKIEQSILIYKETTGSKKYNNILNYNDAKITNIRQKGGGGSRSSDRYILDYSNGNDVINLLGKHLEGLPVYMERAGDDKIKITYTAFDGRKKSHTFVINRHGLFGIASKASRDRRKKDEDGLINFLQQQLAYDRSIARVEVGLINESGQ
tara:strand:+ start:1787 stop:4234 length:2448 start_codon:yes stop_codon:yes gene_type:complete